MSEKPIRLLLVEDNLDDCELTCLELSRVESAKFDVQHAARLSEAVQVLSTKPFDVLLLDLGLPDSEGLAGVTALRREVDDVPIIVLTGNTDEETALRSLHNGAQDYLVKAAVCADKLHRAIRYSIERQRLVRQLTRAKRLLEKKNQRLARMYKTAHRFVDNVSHEFRTPLTVVKEYGSLLREEVVGTVNDEQSRMLDVVVDRADDLNTMVDDMLDVSKLESGLLGASRKNHFVREVFQHVLPSLQRKAAVRGVELLVECEDDCLEVYCDAEKVGRIIINLTINAIKFCGEPGLVRLWAKPDVQHGGAVIGVTDNGPGIDEENLHALFRRFKQLNTDCRSSTKGFGLGLNIAKELVDLNFGNMMVESEVGRGSTFSFTLPASDPGHVMQVYLDRVERLRNGGTNVTLIRAETSDRTNSELADDVETMLGYLLRRNDLMFQKENNAWLLVLSIEEIELDKFLARAEKAFDDANRNRPLGPLPKVDIRSQGSWHLATGKPELMQRFMSELEARQAVHT